MALTCNWTIAVSFVLAIGCAVEQVPARADVNRQRVGDHWFNQKDRGYFKIFNTLDEDVLLFAEPAFGSKVVMPLNEGDIVASDGISHWGGDASWQRIALGTSDGWIPQRQLIRARPRTLGVTGIPVAGSCWGYDPPWTANWNEKILRLSLFPGREQIDIAYSTSSAQSQTSLLTAKSASLSADLIQTAEACAPVQGSYLFGTSGALVLTDSAGKRLLSGCCQAAAAAF